jgi:hypothetical protein
MLPEALAFMLSAVVLVSSTSSVSTGTDGLIEIGVQRYDFESSHALASGAWIHRPSQPPHPDQPLDMYFALEPQNMDQIQSIAADVSNPVSTRYGQHLNGEQIGKIVSPAQPDIDTVTQFLESYGITHRVLTTRHMVRTWNVNVHSMRHTI